MTTSIAIQFSPFQRLVRTAVLSVSAAITLIALAPAAHAGASEQKALIGKLPLGVTLQQATSQQLFDAFLAVLADPALAKFNNSKGWGTLTGEALKAAGPNAANAGEFFGQTIAGGVASPLTELFADRRNLVSLAASTAGSGKGLNVAQIPGLTATVLVNELGIGTIALATKSKAGIGAIYGGRARQIFADMMDPTPEDTAVVLANTAVFGKPSKLSAAVQDIAQWIAAEYAANGADSARFAIRFADGNAGGNLKSATKIITGASAGDSTNAGNIVHNLFNQALLQPNGSLVAPVGDAIPSSNLIAAGIKGATGLVKTVSAVADIEELQKVGNALGQLIGTVNPLKPTTGLLKVAQAAGFVKTLATAVMKKPRGNNSINDPNSDMNKGDEIAEIAAYLVAGLASSPEFNVTGLDPKKQATVAKNAASKILGIIKAAAGVKPKLVAKVAQGPAQTEFAADVAASVALTVKNSMLDPLIKMAVQDLLLLTDLKGNHKTATSILKTASTQIFDRLTDVYNGTNVARFEDGNDSMGAVSDPETDKHPFS